MKTSIVLVTYALAITFPGSGCAAEGPKEVTSYHRTVACTDPTSGATVTLLKVYESDSAAASSRILAETPNQSRVVLSYSRLPRKGLTRYRIEDEATGWWIEVRESGLRLAGTAEDANPAEAVRRWREKEEPVVLEFGAREFPAVRLKTTTWQSIPWDDLTERFRCDGTGEKLKAGIPPSVREGLLSFHSVAKMEVESPNPLADFAPLLEVLGSILTASEPRGYDPFAATAWKVTASKPRRGTRLETVAEKELAGRFRSVSTADLLAGAHVDEMKEAAGSSR